MNKQAGEGGALKFKPFYSIKDLALRWEMSQRHVRREIDNGDLTAHRFGKSIRISAESVAIYEATRKT
jgi:excisionase family DNA binding protein